MSKRSILFAKLAGLQKNFSSLDFGGGRILGTHVEHLVEQYYILAAKLKKEIPELYSDLSSIEKPKPMGKGKNEVNIYYKNAITPIIQRIDYILEVRSNQRIGERKEEKVQRNRVFISHGTSTSWYEVQAFLEKDLELETLELAQEANLGRTILQKLDEEARNCGIAVIVMTGDDEFEDEIRARENVLHEIGFLPRKIRSEKYYFIA